MAATQTSSTAIHKRDLTWRDALWLGLYSVRSVWELANARMAFSRLNVSEIAKGRADHSPASVGPDVHVKLRRMQFVVPRIAARLPWRSDCLIQAIAAKSWLKSLGMDGEIVLGVKNPSDGEFGAHAWLICDGLIVTGGDISEYEPLTHSSIGP